jgi:hypothetical protein
MEDKKGFFEEYRENLGDTRPWDMWDPSVERATEEVASERFSICRSCPDLIKLTSQCKKCGCFMNLKTKLEKAQCPIGKW